MAKPVTSLRVLHTPQNIASLPSHTIRGLIQIGMHPASLIYTNQPIQTADGLRIIKVQKKNFPARFAGKISWFLKFAAACQESDLIHWYYGRSLFALPIDIFLVRLLRKPALVEWMGSDIRVPEVEFAENPYYTRVYQAGYEKAQTENKEKSRRWQKIFADAHFAGAAAIGMRQYVFPDIFPHVHDLPRRLLASDYIPLYPEPGKRLLVVHSPSAPVTKGTACVLDTIQKLQQRYEFDFQLVQNMPRDQAMETLRRADIFLDQFVLGDYGMASLEAMAFGKPVVCFIKSSLAQQYGSELPILNASQESLLEAVETLITDENLRLRLGRQGREYVESYHDMRVVAPRIREIYAQLVN